MAKGQQLKNLLKRSVRTGMRYSASLAGDSGTPRSRILTYHSTGQRRYEMNVTPEHFSEQMEWLAANATVIPLDEAARGKPGVAITFDDGYADNLDNAVPILNRLNLPSTIFVVSGHLGGTLPFEKEPETGRLLTEAELHEVRAAGISIGAHTVNHVRLSTVSEAMQRQEIEDSRTHLEDLLGEGVRAFAYPYGSALDFTIATQRMVFQSGFRFACANQFGHNSPPKDPWALRRIWIDSTDSLASFQDKVTGKLDALAIQDSAVGIRARRWLNRGLGTT